MFLIEMGGERQLVASLEGYDGCTVIAEDVARPHYSYARLGTAATVAWDRQASKWAGDRKRKAAAERAAAIEAMPKAELAARIEQLAAELADQRGQARSQHQAADNSQSQTKGE